MAISTLYKLSALFDTLPKLSSSLPYPKYQAYDRKLVKASSTQLFSNVHLDVTV